MNGPDGRELDFDEHLSQIDLPVLSAEEAKLGDLEINENE